MARRTRRRPAAEPPAARDPQRFYSLVEDPPYLAGHRGPHAKAERLESYRASATVQRRGNSREYLTARIARDRPDILERLQAGEFPTIWSAARAAGVLKQHTALEQLRRAWAKASPAERAQFLSELGPAGEKGR
jgi:hypothetical protein